MTETLLDANVVIALSYETHTHHTHATAWLAGHPDTFATCAITQGALIRFLLRSDASSGEAMQILESLTASPDHRFWPADFPFAAPMLRGVFGHRQVTDAYLAEMARVRLAKVATFDLGLAAAHPDVAELIPT